MSTGPPDRVWYVAYGSNLALARFRRYLCGGPVPGGARVYDGCRDPREPAALVSLLLPGRLVFAGRSRVWGGGIAFYDPGPSGLVACRAYLVSAEQFADVLAQEMRRRPGGRFARDLARLLTEVGPVRTTGPGLYETVRRLGVRGGAPLLTITHADVDDLTPEAPTEPYLRWIMAGLQEAHGWDPDRVGRYLARMPGVAGSWQAPDLAALAGAGVPT